MGIQAHQSSLNILEAKVKANDIPSSKEMAEMEKETVIGNGIEDYPGIRPIAGTKPLRWTEGEPVVFCPEIDDLTLDRRRRLFGKFQPAPLADTTPRTHYSSGRDGYPEPNQFGAEGAWHGHRLAERLRHYEDHYSSGAEGHP